MFIDAVVHTMRKFTIVAGFAGSPRPYLISVDGVLDSLIWHQIDESINVCCLRKKTVTTKQMDVNWNSKKSVSLERRSAAIDVNMGEDQPTIAPVISQSSHPNVLITMARVYSRKEMTINARIVNMNETTTNAWLRSIMGRSAMYHILISSASPLRISR